ncbi:actin-like ATPase domain-containing protein [Gigaspora margarita]|uniref:Actin-like ATPase domain-containing protein n=1 Tax=Gigaspora margarita TaxID=4874 RepID=A0A8H4A1P2_GIGMA|nr:actin-like ATPase domain-containing protein [Gigaspora margarita]
MNSFHRPTSFTSFIAPLEDIRAVVGIDFGTTFSGFAYANKISSVIDLHTQWPGKEREKTNTVLLYDNSCREVLKWGEPALTFGQKKNKKSIKELGSPQSPHVIERFKLHLDEKLSIGEKPWLPQNLNYKRAIIDYLKKMKGVIENTLDKRWPDLKLTQVLFVLCVPAEWGPHTKAIMRDCAYEAELLNESIESHLEFTTEPEAAALHCLSSIQEHGLTVGDTFLVVDCGGGTVDLTMRTIQMGNKLNEETERTGDLCGGTFVDQEFINFIGRTVGFNALQRLRTYAYGELQILVISFCDQIKHRFTGDPDEYETAEFDLQDICPSLINYITGAEKTILENSEWVIELDFKTLKKMFDIVINKIISRILKWTYGVEVKANFDICNDPLELRTIDNKIWKFDLLAVRGTNVSVNQKFCKEYKPLNPEQTMAVFKVYITTEYQPKYIKNENGMRLLGTLKITLSKWLSRGRDRPVEFGLTFGTMEIKATAKNKLTNETCHTTFELDIKR